MKSKDTFIHGYNSDWNSYFNEADRHFRNDFPEDKFLIIKYVGYKVRDLALSTFSQNYIAVDKHVIDVLRRTGLLAYSYSFGIQPSTHPADYFDIRNLCLKLSEKANTSLGELDRILWHFGKTICKGKPNCKKCPITGECLYCASTECFT